MDVHAYLERIGYVGPLTADAETLRRLQTAHLMSVPFENLSIHAGEPIVLDDEALFDKIVTRRRGGFCYELNGLFAWLLRSLDFRVQMIAAEVMNANGEWGPAFDHMALLAALDEQWLVDVGFGDSFVEPLTLESADEQGQVRDAYRIDRAHGRQVVSRRTGDEPWRPTYRFDTTPYEYADYEPMCRYHQTSPDSPFTRNRICSMATPEGRVTLSGMRLIVTTATWRREFTIATEADYTTALRERFGVVLTAS